MKTYYEIIKEYDLHTMAEFLFRFANDTIEQFGNFQFPNKEDIEEFLSREKPELEEN